MRRARCIELPLLLALVAVPALAACGDDPAGGDDDDPMPGPDAALDAAVGPGQDADPSTWPDDPFGAIPDTGEGLTDVAADLDAVLEHGALAGACAAYEAAPNDRAKRLLCGKAMFFYEGYGTVGVPQPIVTWLIDHFPENVGPGFSELGMIEDPDSPLHLPLGLGLGKKLGSIDTLAFTCASCHFGRLPDGRYAVGAPNHDYRYGAQNLMLILLPALAIPGANPADHDPLAIALVQPLRDKMAADPSIGTALITALLPLITGGGGTLPSFDKTNERYYATWRDGTMDFFIQPLPFDDEVHTISKISALWALPTDEERAARDMPSAALGWTGGTASLLNFARSFVHLGGGDLSAWPDSKLGPLVDYIYSLRAPANPEPPAAALVAEGAALFESAGCIACHDGPRGSGRELYTYDEIGTDDAMKWWADGDLDGQPDNDIVFEQGDSVTHKLKSPRLVGLWAMSRFLHNGSVDSLEDLMCLNGLRGDVTELAYGNGGHTYGCDLPEGQRQALIAFLLSH